MTNRGEYLNDNHVSELITFMRDEIVPGNIHVPFFANAGAHRVDAPLIYGYNNYNWRNNNFNQTAEILNDFSGALQEGLNEDNQDATLGAVTNILRWGLMPNAAQHNINTYQRIGTEGLRRAVSILTNDNPDIGEFNELPYNSGFTKVYALIRPETLPIYDSRVSAMMGYIVALYCSEKKLDQVPEKLRLYCMPFHNNRRPVYAGVPFPTTNNDSIRHASAAIRCGWILNELRDAIAKHWNVNPNLCVRAIESALFYAGGRVIPVP